MLKMSTSDDDHYAVIARYTAFVGRAVIAIGFAIAYIWAAEIFPTEVRNLGVGLSSMGGRIGGLLAPQVAKFASAPINIVWLPSAVFGVLSIIAAIIR